MKKEKKKNRTSDYECDKLRHDSSREQDKELDRKLKQIRSVEDAEELEEYE